MKDTLQNKPALGPLGGSLSGLLGRTLLGRTLAVGAVLLCCASQSLAQIRTEIKDDRFYLYDGDDILIDTPEGFGNGGVRPDITIEDHDDGFELVLNYRNENSTPTLMGHLEFWRWRVAGDLGMRRFRHDSVEEAITVAPGGIRQWGSHYPSDSYSPLMTLTDDERTIGVSIMYPVMDYQHGVRMSMQATDRALGGQSWRFVIEWMNTNKPGPGIPPQLLTQKLEPGEEREYRVAFHVVDNELKWFDTIQPYVQYFRTQYGGVTYKTDRGAVRGFHAAGTNLQSSSNPRGFAYGNRRADLSGWAGWADAVAAVRRQGFRRTMIWAPSGLFDNDGYNYPFLFASPLMDMPKARDSIGFLRGLAPRGVDLGFWWGRSQEVMFGWNEQRSELLDPGNPEHVERAFAELDAAARMGVRTIGLDAFTYLPPWEAVPWLQRMRERHPRIKFVIEPSASDLLHRHAAIWKDNQFVEFRNDVADAILPDHETWVGVRFDVLEDRFGGQPLNDTQKLLEIQRIASLGFVPVVQDVNVTIPTGLGASAPASSGGRNPAPPIFTHVPVR